MDQKLPSEKLAQKPRPWRAALLVLGLVAVGIAAVFISGSVLAPDTGRPEAGLVHLVGAPGKPTEPQITHKLLLTDHVAKSTTPPPPPEPVYEAPSGGGGGPVRCPAGSTANSSDGYNDTSCFPNVCFTITVPDPAYPECDYAFKP